jgi:hypothetical protein
LDELTDITGDSKTDAINKALQFFAKIKATLNEGGGVYVREPGSDAVQQVMIF